MDGGAVEISGWRAPIEIDDAAGPPRAWIAFLLTLCAGATALLLVLLAVLPEREAAADAVSITGIVIGDQRTDLHEDITGLAAVYAALVQERHHLTR